MAWEMMIDIGRFRFVSLFVALLCVLAANDSEGNRKLAQTFLPDGLSWDLEDINEDMAKLVWSYCSKELNNNRISDFESTFSVRKAIASLSPKEKETILDCLKENSSTSHVLRVEEEKPWLNKYHHLLPEWGYVPRRYLRRRRRRRNRHRLIISPLQGPAHSPNSLSAALVSQVSSPTPTPTPTPFPSIFLQAPNPALEPPTQVPDQSPSPNEVDINPPPPEEVINPPPPQEEFLNHPSPFDNHSSLPPRGSDTGEKNQNYIIVAIVAGVVAGVSVLALFLFCCLTRNKNKVEPKDGPRYGNPLLNVTGNDTLAASAISKDSKQPSVTTTFQGSSNDESQTSAGTNSSENNNSGLPLPPGKDAPPPPGPPPPPPKPPAPAPPPPPKVRRPPNPPAPKPSPLAPQHRGRASKGGLIDGSGDSSEAPKTKLKPFFWDKVTASPDHSMVWHDLKAGSFQVNEEMMETLFGYAIPETNKNENKKDSPYFEAPQFIQIIDPKKSQNLAILLKALNVTTEEICDALNEGNELPAELIQTLIKMAPTSDEELKLRLYNGDVSQLGPAERFLKVMVAIPFAFKRLEALLFISTYQEEVSSIKDSLSTLEVACKELRNSRLFLKLLEAVLKTGNRMNDGTYRGGAQAFKLDTLLKLSDVKGTDGKTTLLHFVVHEIIRSEGLRAARKLQQSQSLSSVRTEDLIEDASHEAEDSHRILGLQVVAGLSDELENVRKAALIDSDTVATSVSTIGHSLVGLKGFLEKDLKTVDGANEFCDSVGSFLDHAESDIKWLIEEDKRIMDLVQSTGDYFQGRSRKEDGPRLFAVIRDFLLMLDKACKDVKSLTKIAPKDTRKESIPSSPSQAPNKESMRDYHRRLFPSIKRRYTGDDDEFSSSDSET